MVSSDWRRCDPLEKRYSCERKVAEGSVSRESAKKNPDSGSLGLANVLEGSMACELKELIPKVVTLGAP